MNVAKSIVRVVVVGLIVALGALSGGARAAEPVKQAAPPAYRSPYRVEFSVPVEELIPDILRGDRAEPRLQSKVPFVEWYSEETKRRYGSWGPPGVHHQPPRGIDGKNAEWKRQRVIAVGMRYVGLTYQHHYLPDWDPPADWPWKAVAGGKNARGVDCSNFTTFVYNVALGLKPDSGIRQQAELKEAPLANGKTVRAQRIERPASFEEFARVLRTGDLLFIKSDGGTVSHVVLWVGAIGRSPDRMPLILDSTGEGRKDCNGAAIPDGVQLRPFTPTSWYARNASHALRLIPDGPAGK